MTLERWKTFSIRDQMGHIASEILRADLIREKDKNIYLQMIERAINLVDLTLNDEKWRGNFLQLFILRDELAKTYLGENKDLKKLIAAL